MIRKLNAEEHLLLATHLRNIRGEITAIRAASLPDEAW